MFNVNYRMLENLLRISQSRNKNKTILQSKKEIMDTTKFEDSFCRLLI